jgi:hypothetical protein
LYLGIEKNENKKYFLNHTKKIISPFIKSFHQIPPHPIHLLPHPKMASSAVLETVFA